MNAQTTKVVLRGASAAVTALMAGSAMAWVSSMPNAFGGYNYTSSSGGWVSSMPNAFGGFNYTSSSGGFGSSMPNAFGGFNYSGSLFRGAKGESALFDDADVASKIDDGKIADALSSRNGDALTSCAWDLKGVETILGKKDKKTSSDMLFAAAAQMAVEQGNAECLKAIVALSPECKKYQDALAVRGKTRGAGAAPLCALPQVVRVGSEDWKEELKKLHPWQSPLLDATTVFGSFRGISKADAELCSAMINGGRSAMRPLAMATGAVQLSEYKTSDDCCEKMKPASIFKEAVELAMFKGDWKSVKRLSDIYQATNFTEPAYIGYLKELTSMGGASRGILKADEDLVNPDDLTATIDGRAVMRLMDHLSQTIEK